MQSLVVGLIAALQPPSTAKDLHHASRAVVCGVSSAVWSRRAVAGGAASAAWAVMSPAALAADGSWTEHNGPFTNAELGSFTQGKEGFLYKIVKQGNGAKPEAFQQVFVHYTGYLQDGTRFDSSYDKDKGPFRFRLSKKKKKVIAGWEAVVQGMDVGQRVVVKIPAKYAYGAEGKGAIPPNSDLIFYMELVKLGNVKGDKPRLPSLEPCANCVPSEENDE